MPDAAGTGNTAPVLTTVTVLLFLWALVAYFIRLYVKLSQSDGWKADDWAITGAAIGALGQLVAICYGVHRGYGAPWHLISVNDRLEIEHSLYASQILYIATVGLARISASCFVANVLARERRNKLVCLILTGLCGAWTVASIVAISLRGDLLQPWETFNGSQVLFIRWISIEITGFALDLFAAAAIIFFVSSLQMKPSRKASVCAILNVRLLIAVPIAFRLYYLNPAVAHDGAITAETIRQVIIGCNIMFASLTCLKPFLKPFDPAAFGSQHASRTGLFRYTNEPNKNATYYELSANQGTMQSATGGAGRGGDRLSKNMIMLSQRSVNDGEDDEIPLTDNAAVARMRPVNVGHTAEVRHGSRTDDAYGRNISKTQTWTISSE